MTAAGIATGVVGVLARGTGRSTGSHRGSDRRAADPPTHRDRIADSLPARRGSPSRIRRLPVTDPPHESVDSRSRIDRLALTESRPRPRRRADLHESTRRLTQSKRPTHRVETY